MFNSKYSNVLTVLLIIVILVIIALLGFVGYDFYKKYKINKDASEYIAQYEEEVKQNNNEIEEPEDNTGDATNPLDKLDEMQQGNLSGGSSSSKKTYTYKGFTVLGTIEIPKTGINYPILYEQTPKAIETAVSRMYGPMPNEVGNLVIIGHNYRNGAFFGKNKQLVEGDIIYITDNNGKKVKYTIYKKQILNPEDTSYMTRNTNGAREISLSTCTDDSKQRLVIWAKE